MPNHIQHKDDFPRILAKRTSTYQPCNSNQQQNNAAVFKILEKKKAHASNLYGRIVSPDGATVVSDADARGDAVPEGGRFVGASMPYWMRMTPTGVGMHVGYVPGRPASHGCIRLKKDVATELFGILEVGSPVTVDAVAPALEPSRASG